MGGYHVAALPKIGLMAFSAASMPTVWSSLKKAPVRNVVAKRLSILLGKSSVVCPVGGPVYGPSAGALDAESPKSKNYKNKRKHLLVAKQAFSYRFVPYFACAKL